MFVVLWYINIEVILNMNYILQLLHFPFVSSSFVSCVPTSASFSRGWPSFAARSGQVARKLAHLYNEEARAALLERTGGEKAEELLQQAQHWMVGVLNGWHC